MKRTISIFTLFFAISLALISCKEETKKEEQTQEEQKQEEQKSDLETEKGLAFTTENQSDITTLYFDMKDALVSDKGYHAMKIAQVMQKRVTDSEMLATINTIAGTEDIEKQRDAFYVLSQQMLKFVEENITNGTVYKQYCPMAFNDTGAFWLSEEKQILNPYFGKKMLKCGSVQAEITK
ncbi:DUF3347 domain-containing protein [Mesonia sp. K7]|uniref:DUF3347 domain-containing protein n=1 Tax=Mesonia sp. K7 TaxID=2218606 RepID=UPI000DA85AAD|nr:DUF3347 domain-containing protein [Mesonia sp. K7]PZD78268.1 hypothetical protein DNG35_06100 [Mesonia sp. K7]